MTYDPYSGEPVPVDYGRQTQTPTVEVQPAGESPRETRDVVLKGFNDVVSQTQRMRG